MSETSTPPPQNAYFKMAITLMILSLICYLLKLSCNVLLARVLPHGLYGDFTLALRTFMLAASFLLIGTGTASKRFLSSFLRHHKTDKSSEYIAWNLKTITFPIFMFLICLFFFVIILSTLHVFDIKAYHSYHLTTYILFIAPIGAMFLLATSYLHCNNNIYWNNFLSNGLRSFMFILVFGIALHFMDIVINEKELLLITLITYVSMCLIEIFLLATKMPQGLWPKSLAALQKPFKENKDWHRTSTKLMLNQSLYLLIIVIDLYLIEILLHNEADLDIYSAILAITSLVYILSTSIFQFITPKVSHAFQNDDYRPLQKSINHANLVSITICTLIVLLIILRGHTILAHFGPNYLQHHGYLALSILAISYLINALARPAVLILSYTGLQNYLTAVSFIEAIILLALGIPLTLHFGIIGTAVATLIAMTFRAVSFIIITHLKTPIKSLSIF